MALRMEITLQEDVTMRKGDALYLDFYRKDGDMTVFLCVTRLVDGRQQNPKAEVIHAPTMERLY